MNRVDPRPPAKWRLHHTTVYCTRWCDGDHQAADAAAMPQLGVTDRPAITVVSGIRLKHFHEFSPLVTRRR